MVVSLDVIRACCLFGAKIVMGTSLRKYIIVYRPLSGTSSTLCSLQVTLESFDLFYDTDPGGSGEIFYKWAAAHLKSAGNAGSSGRIPSDGVEDLKWMRRSENSGGGGKAVV